MTLGTDRRLGGSPDNGGRRCDGGATSPRIRRRGLWGWAPERPPIRSACRRCVLASPCHPPGRTALPPTSKPAQCAI